MSDVFDDDWGVLQQARKSKVLVLSKSESKVWGRSQWRTECSHLSYVRCSESARVVLEDSGAVVSAREQLEGLSLRVSSSSSRSCGAGRRKTA